MKKPVEKKPRCFGHRVTCDGEPKYIAEILEGPGACFHGSLWCEACMGDSFRQGNPYLLKIRRHHANHT